MLWKEISPEVIEYTKRPGTPVFISSGYPTCHYCHGCWRRQCCKRPFSHQKEKPQTSRLQGNASDYQICFNNTCHKLKLDK
ncbi:MAG: hypothetical protein CVU06_06255 [Bacteroidetes bacterium HGW-Bacteroidetes-22]|nr:MAG: hypothetical protein CVU06_06255 [Bacteroidetes bacterium HGW-Bacteroidetes-22]